MRAPFTNTAAGALVLFTLAAATLLASAGPAAADFRLCNNTSSRVGVAVGYKDGQGWTTEGWWNLPARSCETVLKGNLVARYYYVYAIDYDRGGEWMGQAYMCTRDKEFTIRGIGDCLARGYDRTGFFEVDTGEQRAWTVQLTEIERAAGAKAACRERSPFAGNHGRGIVERRRQLPCLLRRRRRSLRASCLRRRAEVRLHDNASPRQCIERAMRRQRRTKVVATLGPASGDRAVIARLFQAGADVFRINMSHTNHDRMRELVANIREVEAEYNRPIGILVDLQGPKLRLGTFKDGAAEIDKGQEFVLDADPAPGDAKRVQLPHPEIFAAIKPGDALLIDDGKLRLVATEVAAQRIVAQVEVGGKVSNRKGVSLPDTVVPLAALAPKDIADLEAALDAGVDWIALSFIQRPEDIAEAKKITRGRAAVMAKIEKPQAVARLSDILELADALMVARGDLGVEMPLEKVPGVQKEMTRACRRAGKPVVVATQMLESMISSPVPTRAEVSDVATAIFDGADAVMLSAESASGQYPVEAVATMNRIAEEVEDDSMYLPSVHMLQTPPERTGADAIATAARQVGETLDLSAIVCWTVSGSTGLRVSRERPKCPIVAISPMEGAGRKLSVVWGIHCVIDEDAKDQDDMVERACRIAFKERFAKAGERVIIVAGVPLGTPGATNFMRIAYVGDGSGGE